MKKYLLITVILIIILSSMFTVLYTGASQNIPVYSDEFFKIAVTFYGNTSTSRAFSFFTRSHSYENNCYIQLDPAPYEQQKPKFFDIDNILIKADSEYTASTWPKQLRHKAYVDNLSPATKYFYRVGCKKTNEWSDYGYFVTDDKDSNFCFLHITDSQGKNQEDFHAFGKSLQKAYEIQSDYDFIVSTGDQVELGVNARQWDMYFASAQSFLLQTTFAPVNGNHELVPQPVSNHFYLNLDSKLIEYTFEYGDAVFVILDSNNSLYDEQIEYLRNVFQNTDKKWKIAAFHYAPFSSGTHADDKNVLNVKEKIVPVLADCGVDLVLNGHDHIYCRTYPINSEGNIGTWQYAAETALDDGGVKYTYTNPQGVFYVINRCVGTKFYSKSNLFNDRFIQKGDSSNFSKPVFSTVKVSRNSLIYTAYEYDRNNTESVKIWDCFEIIKQS